MFKKIEKFAYAFASGKSLGINENVESVGEKAFPSLLVSYIDDIFLPYGVKNINENAFLFFDEMMFEGYGTLHEFKKEDEKFKYTLKHSEQSLEDIVIEDYMLLTPPSFVKDDEAITGWYFDENYTTKARFPLARDQDTTLYAKWDLIAEEGKESTLKLEGNSSSVNLDVPFIPNNTGVYIFETDFIYYSSFLSIYDENDKPINYVTKNNSDFTKSFIFAPLEKKKTYIFSSPIPAYIIDYIGREEMTLTISEEQVDKIKEDTKTTKSTDALGQKCLSFSPAKTGYYDINLDNDDFSLYSLYDEYSKNFELEQIEESRYLTRLLTAGNNYYIFISGEPEEDFSITIKATNFPKIAANQTKKLVEFDENVFSHAYELVVNESGYYQTNISTNAPCVECSFEFYDQFTNCYSEYYWEAYVDEEYEEIYNEGHSVNYFKAGKTYLLLVSVWLEETTDISLTFKLEKYAIKTLNLGKEEKPTSSGIFAITPQETGEYKIGSLNINQDYSDSNLAIKVFLGNGYSLPIDSFDSQLVVLELKKGLTYHIYFDVLAFVPSSFESLLYYEKFATKPIALDEPTEAKNLNLFHIVLTKDGNYKIEALDDPSAIFVLLNEGDKNDFNLLGHGSTIELFLDEGEYFIEVLTSKTKINFSIIKTPLPKAALGETISLNGLSEVIFEFIPEEDNTYIIQSYGSDDPLVYLLDEDFTQLTNGIFGLTTSLEGGKTYYIEIDNYWGDVFEDCSFDITLWTYPNATLDETIDLSGKTGETFKFIPDEDGIYIIQSYGSDDPIVYLLDEDLIQITNDDDRGENDNFLLTVFLEGGKTYYIEINNYWGDVFEDCSFDVKSFFNDSLEVGENEKEIEETSNFSFKPIEGNLYRVKLTGNNEMEFLLLNYNLDTLISASGSIIEITIGLNPKLYALSISLGEGISGNISIEIESLGEEINEEDYQQVLEGIEIIGTVSKENNEYYYFEPEETGVYVFSLETSDTQDSISICLFNENHEFLVGSEVWSYEDDVPDLFSASAAWVYQYFYEGEKYYIQVLGSQSGSAEASISLRINKLQIVSTIGESFEAPISSESDLVYAFLYMDDYVDSFEIEIELSEDSEMQVLLLDENFSLINIALDYSYINFEMDENYNSGIYFLIVRLADVSSDIKITMTNIFEDEDFEIKLAFAGEEMPLEKQEEQGLGEIMSGFLFVVLEDGEYAFNSNLFNEEILASGGIYFGALKDEDFDLEIFFDNIGITGWGEPYDPALFKPFFLKKGIYACEVFGYVFEEIDDFTISLSKV